MTLDDYEKSQIQLYADFAQTVAAILTAAIESAETFLPPVISHRAKTVKSLRKKMAGKEIPQEADVREVIKDIAGCRAVFYTGSDADSISNSSLIYQTFAVDDEKQHYPTRGTQTVGNLYIGKHYWVRLTAERLALAEYKRFSGLMCEIQIQTILNHTWAEIEHDIIYKSPETLNFGERELSEIGASLARIHGKYLKNAGYELDNVIHRYNRLMLGKALFDSSALDAIVTASDNNIRFDAIESFREFVLRQYDDIPAVMAEIVQKLIAAARVAREVVARPIETDFGPLPPKTFTDVLEGICDILTEIRYRDIASPIILEAMLELYSMAETELQRSPVLRLAEAVSTYDLDVWKHIGPRVQSNLVEFVDRLPSEVANQAVPLIIEILGNALSTELEGRSWNSTSVSIRSGAVSASKELRALRAEAIKKLKATFEVCSLPEERRSIVQKLFNAMRTPHRGIYSVELAQIVSIDSLAIINFFVEQATTLPFDERQSLEHQILWHYRHRTAATGELAGDKVLVEVRKQLAEAAKLFRDAANSDPEFVLYKILVGFESVFPEAWENRDFDYHAEDAYRKAQVELLLDRLDDWPEDVWFRRLNLFASTKSEDLATFPVFGDFMRRIATQKPEWALKWIVGDDSPILRFFPGLLSGLLESNKHQDTITLIEKWIDHGKHLDNIAFQMRYAKPFDEARLVKILEKAFANNDLRTIRICIEAADRQFEANPGQLIERVFLPAVTMLAGKEDTSWVHSILGIEPAIVKALNYEQSKIILDALRSLARIRSTPEYVISVITENWPDLGLCFLQSRRLLDRSDKKPENFKAIPYKPHRLNLALSKSPELFFSSLSEWFADRPSVFQFEGATLLESVFPGYPDIAKRHLENFLETNPSFVIACLEGFEGTGAIYPTMYEVIKNLPVDSPLFRKADFALDASGVISGEFGRVERNNRLIELLQPWLVDDTAKIRDFALMRIDHLTKANVAETQRVEAEIAARKLAYGEDLGDDK